MSFSMTEKAHNSEWQWVLVTDSKETEKARSVPVMPRNVYELVPPPADDHSHIKPQHERQWNQIREALAVDGNVFKHPVDQRTSTY